MSDATYNPGGTPIYHKQGGNELVVGSSGVITLESGGSIAVGSGASIAVASGGSLTVPVTSGTTTAALSNTGISTVTKGTTGTGVNNYTISDPVAGSQKWISCTTANVSEFVTITASTAVTFLSGTSLNKLKFVAAGGVQLAGIDASTWSTIGLSTTVAFPTS